MKPIEREDYIEYATKDFALTIPSGWNRKLILHFYNDTSKNERIGIVITQDTLEDGANLDSFILEQKETLQNQLDGFSMIDETEIDGTFYKKITKITYTWKPTSCAPVLQHQAFLAQDSMVWTLTGTTSSSDNDTIDNIFTNVVRSFRGFIVKDNG